MEPTVGAAQPGGYSYGAGAYYTGGAQYSAPATYTAPATYSASPYGASSYGVSTYGAPATTYAASAAPAVSYAAPAVSYGAVPTTSYAPAQPSTSYAAPYSAYTAAASPYTYTSPYTATAGATYAPYTPPAPTTVSYEQLQQQSVYGATDGLAGYQLAAPALSTQYGSAPPMTTTYGASPYAGLFTAGAAGDASPSPHLHSAPSMVATTGLSGAPLQPSISMVAYPGMPQHAGGLGGFTSALDGPFKFYATPPPHMMDGGQDFGRNDPYSAGPSAGGFAGISMEPTAHGAMPADPFGEALPAGASSTKGSKGKTGDSSRKSTSSSKKLTASKKSNRFGCC